MTDFNIYTYPALKITHHGVRTGGYLSPPGITFKHMIAMFYRS